MADMRKVRVLVANTGESPEWREIETDETDERLAQHTHILQIEKGEVVEQVAEVTADIAEENTTKKQTRKTK